MNILPYSLTSRGLVTTLVLYLAVCQWTKGQDAAPEATCVSIPLPAGDRFSNMIAGPDSTLWILTGGKVFFRDGAVFREPVVEANEKGIAWVSLHGGGHQEVYALRRSGNPREVLLYRLQDGTATQVTSLYAETPYKINFYLSRSGNSYNWGTRFLEHLTSTGWVQIEAVLRAQHGVQVFDLGESVHFLSDDRLYRDGPDGLVEQTLPPLPPWYSNYQIGQRLNGAVWNKSCALLVHDAIPGAFLAIDLVTGLEVPLDAARTALRKTVISAVLPRSDGSVWLWGKTKGQDKSALFKLDALGTVTPVLSPDAITQADLCLSTYPPAVISTSSGAMVFGLHEGGIAILENGKIRRLGWREGFFYGVHHLVECPDDAVWAVDGDRIVRVLPGSHPPLFTDGTWEEVQMVPYCRIWSTSPAGHLATIRAERPDALARWDGTNWSYQPLPYDPTCIHNSLVDDQGHLLIDLGLMREGAYDIAPDAITHYDSFKALLLSRVQQGVRTFPSGQGIQAVVAPPNQVWLAYPSEKVVLFDGAHPDPLTLNVKVRRLHMTDDLGILIDAYDAVYTYEQGRLKVVRDMPTDGNVMLTTPGDPFIRGQSLAFLLGSSGLQPYDRDLALRFPTLYSPVMLRGPQHRLYFSVEEFEAARDNATLKVASYPLPSRVERLLPAPGGGAWLIRVYGNGLPMRLFGRQLVDAKMAGTPLQGKAVFQAHEDCAGNLWFLTEGYTGIGHAFVRRLDKARLSLDSAPKSCGRHLQLGLTLTPSSLTNEFRSLVRLNGSDWMAGETNGPAVSFRFSRSGTYTLEIGGLVMGARLRTTLAPITLTAKVTQPETIRTDDGVEITIRDPFWCPPIAIRPTDEEASQALLWSMTGETWLELPPDKIMNLVKQQPGRHTIHFAAEEDGFWRDLSPEPVVIQYKPNFEAAVERRANDLLHTDTSVRERARQELTEMGSIARDLIARRIKAIEAETRFLPALRGVLNQIE